MSLNAKVAFFYKLSSELEEVSATSATNVGTLGFSAGKIGNAAVSDGATQWLTHGDLAAARAQAGAFHRWCWVYIDNDFSGSSGSPLCVPFAKWAGGGDWVFTVWADGHVSFDTAGGGVSSTDLLSQNTWHLIHAWWDGANLNIAIDNGTADSASASAPSAAGATLSLLSGEGGGSYITLGAVDAAGGANSSLDAGEFSELWNSGAGYEYTAPSAPTPSVSLSASTTAIAENGGSVSILALLSETASATVTVAVGFAGAATNGSDYTLSTDTIAIASGQTSGSLTATAINDSVYEGDEPFTASITSVTGGGASASSTASKSVVTIVDDEVAPAVNLSQSTTTVAENLATAHVIARLANASYQDVTVNFGFSGSATLNTDYSASSNSLVVTAGNTSGSISITAIQDTLDEDNEAIRVGITSVTNGSAGATSSLSVTITDDDALPSVAISASAATIAEHGGTAYFLGTLSAPSGRTASHTVFFNALSTATENTDFTASTGIFYFPAGATSASIGVTSLADAVFEPNETIVGLLVGNAVNCSLGTPFSASITIVNEYLPPFVSLAASTASITENSGSATVLATLDHSHSQNVTIVFGLGGTANSSSDYSISTNSIVIASGATSGSISITALQDSISESPETVIVSLSSVTNGTAASAASVATVTIRDDDSRGTGATGLSALSGLSGIH